MKVSDIKCNGEGSTFQAKSSIPAIQTAVSLFRLRFSEDEIFEKLPDGDYHPGIRFNSDSDVTIRIATGLVSEAKSKLQSEDPIIIEGYIKAFVDSLSGTEMDQLIFEGLRDCASADHWYAFEKEW